MSSSKLQAVFDCIVPGCTNNTKTQAYLKFYPLPYPDKKVCQEWARRIRNPKLNKYLLGLYDTDEDQPMHKVCESHFHYICKAETDSQLHCKSLPIFNLPIAKDSYKIRTDCFHSSVVSVPKRRGRKSLVPLKIETLSKHCRFCFKKGILYDVQKSTYNKSIKFQTMIRFVAPEYAINSAGLRENICLDCAKLILTSYLTKHRIESSFDDFARVLALLRDETLKNNEVKLIRPLEFDTKSILLDCDLVINPENNFHEAFESSGPKMEDQVKIFLKEETAETRSLPKELTETSSMSTDLTEVTCSPKRPTEMSCQLEKLAETSSKSKDLSAVACVSKEQTEVSSKRKYVSKMACAPRVLSERSSKTKAIMEMSSHLKRLSDTSKSIDLSETKYKRKCQSKVTFTSKKRAKATSETKNLSEMSSQLTELTEPSSKLKEVSKTTPRIKNLSMVTRVSKELPRTISKAKNLSKVTCVPKHLPEMACKSKERREMSLKSIDLLKMSIQLKKLLGTSPKLIKRPHLSKVAHASKKLRELPSKSIDLSEMESASNERPKVSPTHTVREVPHLFESFISPEDTNLKYSNILKNKALHTYKPYQCRSKDVVLKKNVPEKVLTHSEFQTLKDLVTGKLKAENKSDRNWKGDEIRPNIVTTNKSEEIIVDPIKDPNLAKPIILNGCGNLNILQEYSKERKVEDTPLSAVKIEIVEHDIKIEQEEEMGNMDMDEMQLIKFEEVHI